MSKASKQSELFWYYYICYDGAGHQNTSDGFMSFDVALTKEELKDCFDTKFRDAENADIRYWPIDGLPEPERQNRIRNLKLHIKSKQTELKQLQDSPGIPVSLIDGEDIRIVKLLRNRRSECVLRKLHKVGCIIYAYELWHLSRGWKKFANPTKRIYEAIRRAAKYPT